MGKIEKQRIIPIESPKYQTCDAKEVIKIEKQHTGIVIGIITIGLMLLVYLVMNISTTNSTANNIPNNTPKTNTNLEADGSIHMNRIGDTDIVDDEISSVDKDATTKTSFETNQVMAGLNTTNSTNVKAAEQRQSDNSKVIYLTFDDGPTSPITDNILDVLKEKKVNATFFVIGNKVKLKANLMKRIHNEGHAIGLHTFTHDYHKIYRSQEAFLNEMDRSAEEIHDLLNIRPNIIRFPTGSTGHLNKSLYQKLKEKDYRIYDWNARITDGVHPEKSPYTFYKEALKSGGKWNTIYMLMHCDALNKNTCKALPQIIDYYKEHNYIFKVIDKNTPEYYFRYEKKKSKRNG